MSLADAETALRVFAERPEQSFFAGPRSAALISQAEAALGGALPPAYRLFVERFGAGSYGSIEIYGVIAEPFHGPIPDAVWITMDERRKGFIPEDMIIIGDSGDGGYYCIRQGLDGPVALIWPNGASESVAPDFGAYLIGRLTLEEGPPSLP